jgi:NADH:ubiquinone oxidoreductase subunit F (NADH-binding)
MLSGSATITPSDGGDPLTLEAGNAVTFHKGFKCEWKITKRMKKHYAMFVMEDGEDGKDEEEDVPAITCLEEEMEKKIHAPSLADVMSEEMQAQINNFRHTLSHGLGDVKNCMKEGKGK